MTMIIRTVKSSLCICDCLWLILITLVWDILSPLSRVLGKWTSKNSVSQRCKISDLWHAFIEEPLTDRTGFSSATSQRNPAIIRIWFSLFKCNRTTFLSHNEIPTFSQFVQQPGVYGPKITGAVFDCLPQLRREEVRINTLVLEKTNAVCHIWTTPGLPEGYCSRPRQDAATHAGW